MGLTGGYAGWRNVAACFLMALFAWGLGFYSHGIYLTELQKSTGWSTSFISSVITGHYLLSAALLVGIADVMDRLGPRTVVLAGVVLQAAAVLMLPQVRAPWQLVVAYVLFAVAWTCMSSVPIATLVGRWFDRRRGLALNLSLSGATVAGIVIAPAMLFITASAGFGAATVWLVGAMVVVLGITVPMFVRWPRAAERDDDRATPPAGAAPPDQPQGQSQAQADPHASARARTPAQAPSPAHAQSPAHAPPLDRRAVLARQDFWTIAGSFALALLVQVGFLTQQVAILRPSLTQPQIGLAIALTTGTALVGRIVMGLFIDRLDQRRASSFAFLSQAAALVVVLLSSAPWLLLAACVVYGFSVGNVITLAALIVQKEFPARSYGTVVGLSTAIGQVTYSFGPAVYGWLRDLSDGYRVPLLFGISLLTIAGIVVLQRGRSACGG
ncbi:MAG TPA: MFS transporter [Burkholderiaceae bacterium]|nr:MFS transporter [Burkholderiaceae bacterium]